MQPAQARGTFRSKKWHSDQTHAQLITIFSTQKQKFDQAGAVLPYVIITTLIIFLGVVMLASRSSESNLSASRQSDYNAAKEAAEFGMAETIASMNSASLGHLWVTKWGVDGSGWKSTTEAQATTCMIKSASFQTGEILLGEKSLPTSANASYKIINYEAPTAYITATGCSAFGNLIGGSATLSVTGNINRGGQPVSSYILKRRIHVIGPTVGGLGEFPLVILGNGSKINNADDGFVQAESPYSVNKQADLSIACLLSTSNCFSSDNKAEPSKTKVAEISSLPMPTYPQPPIWSTSIWNTADSGNPADACTNGDITTQGSTSSTDPYRDFPYKAGTTQINPCYCIDTTSTVNNTSTAEVTCKVNNITINAISASAGGILKINTSKPVNIYLHGNISTGSKSYLGSKDVIDDVSPKSWSRLRIYGLNTGNLDTCASNLVTTPDVGVFRGAFVWLPYGTVDYTSGGGAGNTATNFGILWTCRFLGPASSNSYYGARLDSPDGLGDIFGPAFSGISDLSAQTGLPSSPHFYRGYGTSE